MGLDFAFGILNIHEIRNLDEEELRGYIEPPVVTLVRYDDTGEYGQD